MLESLASDVESLLEVSFQAELGQITFVQLMTNARYVVFFRGPRI
jgi:hypothetical protein